jgi:hypothetical protein
MQRINAVLMHGNLADARYTENQLGAKFKLIRSNPQPDGLGGDDTYDSNQFIGNPIHVYLNIATSFGGGSDIDLLVGEEWPPKVNLVDDCFHISVSAFSSYFGGQFSTSYMGGFESWQKTLSRNDNSTVTLTVTTDEKI